MVRSIFVAAVAASCLLAAHAALDMNNPLTAESITACNQLGAAPANLTDELPEGYDYTCYTEQKYVKRWASTEGIPETMLAMGSGTLMADGQTYLMGSPLVTIVPFFAFGLLATITCGIWSCGMCACCGKSSSEGSACCCGKCCSKPPAFTKGVGGWIMVIITAGAGVAVVVLALSGLGVNNNMNEALEQIGGSVSILESWTNSTSTKLGVSVDKTESLLATVNTLDAVVAGMQTTQIKADLKDTVAEIPTFVQSALDGLIELDGQVAMLAVTVNDLGDSLGDSVGGVNSLRQTGMFWAWLVLAIFMAFEILVAILRKIAPKKTAHCCCGLVFGTVTFVYCFVMFIMFLVTAIVALITMILADVCSDPDALFITVIGGATASLETPDLGSLRARRVVEGSGDGTADASASGGADFFGYFITCDTQNSVTNPFNIPAEQVLTKLGGATGELAGVDAFFVDFEAGAGYTGLQALSATQTQPTSIDKYVADKKSLLDAVAAIKGDVDALGVSLSGEADSSAVDWSANSGHGLTEGTLSSVNCYQVNARYQAMINLICTYTFGTLAQSCEYFMAAAVLMVFIQWAKRWSRPHPRDDAYDDTSDGDKDFADNGGDPMANTLNSL